MFSPRLAVDGLARTPGVRLLLLGLALLVLLIGGCNLGRIIGAEAAFYTLAEANGQRVGGGEDQLLIGSIPYQNTTCDLLLRSGRLFTETEQFYDLHIGMDLRCMDGASGEAHAAATGTYTIRNGTITFQPIEIDGVETGKGTVRGSTITLDARIDAAHLIMFQFPQFSVEQEFPLSLRFVKTAED